MTKTKKNTVNTKLYSTEPYADELMALYMEHDSFDYTVNLEVGEKIKGTLMETKGDYIAVDVNHKDYVFIESRGTEFIALQRANKVAGDQVEVLITEVVDNPYMVKGSFAALGKQNVVTDILNNPTGFVDAFVKDCIPAGYNVELLSGDFRIPAFMPHTIAGINKLHDQQIIVGKTLQVGIELYDEAKGTFVASRKKYLQSLIPAALEKLHLIDEDSNPIPYQGIVTGTTSFGVFVEFNECLTGMIHKANLSQELVDDGIQNIKPGTVINFFVKENMRGKLILTQIWRVTLWDTIKKDDVFEAAQIREVKHSGLLIALDEETFGLIHNTELDRRKRYKEGDTIQVKVSQVSRTDRKIQLALA